MATAYGEGQQAIGYLVVFRFVTNATDGIGKFGGWVAPLLRAYPSLEVRSLAFSKDGAWFNLYTRARLSPLTPSQPTSRLIRAHPAFMIRQDSLQSSYLRAILAMLPREILKLPGVEISLATPPRGQNQAQTPSKSPIWWHASQDFAGSAFWDGRSPSEEPVRKYALSANSGEAAALPSPEDLEQLDVGLLRQRPRWLGVPDLARRFLRAEDGWTFNHNTQFVIELSLQCELQAPRVTANGLLEVPLLAPARLSDRRLKVSALLTSAAGEKWMKEASVRGVPGSGPDGRSGRFARVQWSGAWSVTLHLILDDRVVDKAAYDLWAGRSPNPRMAALKSLGEAMAQLEGTLAGDAQSSKDAESLEIAVANLMATGGFVTIHAGRKHAKAGEVVDVVAIHPLAPVAFCVECTLGPAGNKEKLAKLEMRTRQLSLALPGFTVKAVGVVAAEESSPADVTESTARGVVLLNRTHLRALRTKVEWDAGPSAIAKWLLGNQPLPKPRV